MYDNTKEFVQAVRILGIVHGVKQPELERECDAISKLNILPDIFLIFEALEMQGEYIWQLLDFHPTMTKGISIGAGECKTYDSPFLCLLQIAASVAEELVPLTEHLAGAELPQTCRDARVLLDVDGKVEEGLVAGRDGFAREATGLTREHALE